jgi:hypothetical protein
LARQKPVLMLFEDVHWADATCSPLDLTVERVRRRFCALHLPAGIRGAPDRPRTSPASRSTACQPPKSRPWLERAAGQPLPAEVTAQIVIKTDGAAFARN